MQTQSQKTPFLFLITLILMSIGGLIGSDMYLPALPALMLYLNTTDSTITSCNNTTLHVQISIAAGNGSTKISLVPFWINSISPRYRTGPRCSMASRRFFLPSNISSKSLSFGRIRSWTAFVSPGSPLAMRSKRPRRSL